MYFTKKLIYILSICALLVSALVSCGNGDGAGDNGGGDENNPPAHIHAYGEWETRKVPTCVETGREVRSCECGERETRVTDIVPHTWKDATAFAPKTCTVCGATEGEPIEIPGLEITDRDSPLVPWG